MIKNEKQHGYTETKSSCFVTSENTVNQTKLGLWNYKQQNI